jgi:hypothetical protein
MERGFLADIISERTILWRWCTRQRDGEKVPGDCVAWSRAGLRVGPWRRTSWSRFSFPFLDPLCLAVQTPCRTPPSHPQTPISGHELGRHCHVNQAWQQPCRRVRLDMTPPPDPHYRHRFPAEIISHAIWLCHVFSLSLRNVELILAERGIVVSYETVRRWYKQFAASFTDRLRRRRPRPGDKWHMDEVFIRIQACSTTFGAPSIRMALCSTSWFRLAAMARRRNASSNGC